MKEAPEERHIIHHLVVALEHFFYFSICWEFHDPN